MSPVESPWPKRVDSLESGNLLSQPSGSGTISFLPSLLTPLLLSAFVRLPRRPRSETDTDYVGPTAPVDPEWMLHPILLSGWGTPIGELFDLEALSEVCKRHQRWSFFFTSSPLNYTGAVATPPNAMAIF